MGSIEQHFQPPSHNDPEGEAEAIIHRITENSSTSLTEEDKEILRKGGYGDLITDIENHKKDPTVPPWMH